MNVFYKFVSYINPIAGARRARARHQETVFRERQRAYEAAARGRRTSDWNANSTSANTEISMAATVLRNRSRDLCRNNPYAVKAVRSLVNNVVGSGIKPSIQMTGSNRRLVASTKKAWKDWAESTECDFERRKTFPAIQAMAMRAVAESGECFIRQHFDAAAAAIPLRLQVLEADFLDTLKDGIQIRGGGFIMQGIEHDAMGRRVAYWMHQVHPGENRIFKSLTSVRIPAEEIIHVYYAERPGQIRGVPVGVSAMLRSRSLDEYDDAEIMRKKVAACFSAFVTDPEGDPGIGRPNPDSYDAEYLEPGTIQYLPNGKTVQLAAPPPSDGYGEFNTAALRAMAAGFGVTYEAMSNDYSQVNFSSGRMGWIEMGNFIAEFQDFMMVPVLCSTVWEWFVKFGTISGVTRPGLSVNWTCPRRPMLDPVKETKGLSEMVRNGFKSWQDAVREQGDDPDVVIAELTADFEAFKAAGLMLVCDPAFDPNRTTDKPAEPPNKMPAQK